MPIQPYLFFQGRADEAGLLEMDEMETDPLLIEGLEDEEGAAGDDDGAAITPALAQVLEGDAAETAETVEEDGDPAEEDDVVGTVSGTNAPEEVEEISLEDVEEPDDDEDQPQE